MSSSKEENRAIILKSGVPFITWSSDLRSALAQEGLVGYVFHSVPEIRPKTAPISPTDAEAKADPETIEKYLDDLEAWKMKDLHAYGIILRRIDPSLRPESSNTLTALELFTMISNTHKPSAAIPYRSCFKKLITTKFTTTATNYCNEFLRNLSNFRNAAANLESTVKNSQEYGISDGLASIMFFEGTAHIDWLETWRATGAVDRERHAYASLEQMMASLRDTSGDRQAISQSALVATPLKINDDDQCYIHPKLNHSNKQCRAQHPELRTIRPNRGREHQGRSNVVVPLVESQDNFSLAMAALPSTLKLAASVSGFQITRDTFIWDSGASNHFINSRSAFVNLAKLENPFIFDQAIHKTSLNYGGTAHVKIGNLNLELTEAL
ncbi:hypothetical protein K3495_g15734, partial [Podosphaera aphanis]